MIEENKRKCITVGCNDTVQVKALLRNLNIDNMLIIPPIESQYGRGAGELSVEPRDLFDMIYGTQADKAYYEKQMRMKPVFERTFRKQLNFGVCIELEDLARLVWAKADTLLYINMRRYLKLFSRERQLFYRIHHLEFLQMCGNRKIVDGSGTIYSKVTYRLTSPIPQYTQFSSWLFDHINGTIEIILIDEERENSSEDVVIRSGWNLLNE